MPKFKYFATSNCHPWRTLPPRRLTLGYYYIRKEVEKMLTFTTEAMLDKEEIEEDPEAPPEVLDVD